MPDQSPALRSLYGRRASYESWARTENRSARTEPARRAAEARFERLVDPDGVMSPSERAKAAEAARRSYFLGLAAKSVKARQARKGSLTAAERAAEQAAAVQAQIDAELKSDGAA